MVAMKIEKIVIKAVIITTSLFLACWIFVSNGYRFKGIYTSQIITSLFILSSVFFYYFFLIRMTIKKLIACILLLPLLAMGIFSLPIGLFSYTNSFKVNDKYQLVIRSGAPMSCGQHIVLSETKFFLLYKDVYRLKTACLSGISKIETVVFDNKHAEFKIYHDKNSGNESPYSYKVENKNFW